MAGVVGVAEQLGRRRGASPACGGGRTSGGGGLPSRCTGEWLGWGRAEGGGGGVRQPSTAGIHVVGGEVRGGGDGRRQRRRGNPSERSSSVAGAGRVSGAGLFFFLRGESSGLLGRAVAFAL